MGFTYVSSTSITFRNFLGSDACKFQTEWGHYTPVFAFSLFYILSAVLCVAVGIMMSYHMWQVCTGETSVDSHDHRVYREVAKERGGVSTQNFVPYSVP